jgi:hypothetical protein
VKLPNIARKVVPTVMGAPSTVEIKLANENNAAKGHHATVIDVDFSIGSVKPLTVRERCVAWVTGKRLRWPQGASWTTGGRTARELFLGSNTMIHLTALAVSSQVRHLPHAAPETPPLRAAET